MIVFFAINAIYTSVFLTMLTGVNILSLCLAVFVLNGKLDIAVVHNMCTS
ncbi:MAG: hypothetical protein PWQ75_1322 [Methanolobus sp.]|jgi:hypothetical protein|nr:hypothetical protein [Methanolobus sp.]